MKRIITLAICMLTFYSAVQAAVFTVNNNNPSPGQFSTIPAAIDAASNGDTIYVHGSANLYSELIQLSKKLTFIGPGLLPASASGSVAKISGQFQFILGSGGSTLIGLYFTSQVTFNSGGTGDRDNITFDRCAFFSTMTVSGNGWSINRCVFNVLNVNTGGNNGFITFNSSPQNTIVSNSLFINNSGSGVSSSSHINSTFSRNLFIRITSGSIAFQTSPINGMQEASFFENIVLGLNLVTNCSNCNYVNNLTFIPSYMSGTLPDLNANGGSSGNITGDPLFTAFPNSTTLAQYDLANAAVFNPVLLPGSPALTAGATNSEIGLFGGIVPFSMFGEPDLPIVRSFIIQNLVVPAGTNLQVEFTATPNN